MSTVATTVEDVAPPPNSASPPTEVAASLYRATLSDATDQVLVSAWYVSTTADTNRAEAENRPPANSAVLLTEVAARSYRAWLSAS